MVLLNIMDYYTIYYISYKYIINKFFYKQENFKFDIDDYKILKDKSDTLVVYFSRMGYTRKIAYDEAINNKANILELKTSELTSSTKGFWWCGRFGMHKWCMKINDINVDLKKYKKLL